MTMFKNSSDADEHAKKFENIMLKNKYSYRITFLIPKMVFKRNQIQNLSNSGKKENPFLRFRIFFQSKYTFF